MKSLIIFAFSLSFLFANSVNATKLAEPVVQVHERALYEGGWALALMASESAGCPAEAPVQCTETGSTLECCPSNQICHIGGTDDVQYCCPTGLSILLLLSSTRHNSSTIVLTCPLICRKRLPCCRYKFPSLRKLILDHVRNPRRRQPLLL
jgi:hypothetical protein